MNKTMLLAWRICLLLLLPLGLSQAAKPIFSLEPTTPTSMFLPANSAEIVQYKVTNHTQKSRTITMRPIAGVAQTAEGCSNPFTLAPQQSCLLTLLINGSAIPTHLRGGPVVCQTLGTGNTPSPYLCARPEAVDVLDVSVTAAKPTQKAYITNWTGNSVSLCDVNALDGSFSNCTITASGSPQFVNPEAIALSPDKTLAYIANIGGNSVVRCAVNSNGSLSNCALNSPTFNGADGVALNPAGTLAYISNAVSNNVAVCQVESTTGSLTNCRTTGNNFNKPSDLTMNPTGTVVYVSNLISGTVSTCPIEDATGLINCTFKTPGFNSPEGISLHPTGRFVYVANNGSNNITLCSIAPLTNNLFNCKVTGGHFNGVGNIAFNALGTRAYVPLQISDQVLVCAVNTSNGELSRCRDSQGSGFNGPSGIVLK